MTTLNVNTITPSGSTLTLGASGDTVVVTDDVKVNTVKDAGGNTLFQSNGSGTLSSVNNGFGGSTRLISTTTISNQASVIISLSTYTEYVFKFIHINPASNGENFNFQCSINGSDYDLGMLTTAWRAYKAESGGSAGTAYQTAQDQILTDQVYQPLMHYVGNGGDEGSSGELHLYNASSTTYTKNFWSVCSIYDGSAVPTLNNWFSAGYFNTTSALTHIQFKMASGNLNAGKIKMYGIV